MEDRLGQAGAMTIPFRESVNALVKDRFKKTQFDDTMDRPLPVISAQAAQIGAEAQKTADGHVHVERGVFGQIANEPFGGKRLRAQVITADADLAIRWGNETRKRPAL